MKIGVYYVASFNTNSEELNAKYQAKIEQIGKDANVDMKKVELENVKDCDLVFSFIGGGGTEGRFLEVLDKLPQPVFLLTTGENNSLAASMEILSYLHQNDIPGEIIHGSDEYVAKRVALLTKVFAAKKKINNLKIGRVGVPSDWLISSNVNAEDSKEINGIEIVDIDMQEFFDEINKHTYEENEYTKSFNLNKYNEDEKKLALDIYGALKRICNKYALNGVTVRCFDLLKPVKGTGCVALAILNAEGIYAACEGDTPALISMAVLGELTGEPVFMANPSRILTDSNEIIFAHCTLPINMSNDYQLMSHYESGIGVAFRAKIKEGPITVFKTDGLMQTYFVSKGVLEKNLQEATLCRTQILLKLDRSVEYFLTESIGNHHLIIKGDHEEEINEFYKWL